MAYLSRFIHIWSNPSTIINRSISHFELFISMIFYHFKHIFPICKTKLSSNFIRFNSVGLIISTKTKMFVTTWMNNRRSGGEMVIKLKLSAVVEMNWTELAVFQDRREMKFSPIVVARRRRRGADCLSLVHLKNACIGKMTVIPWFFSWLLSFNRDGIRNIQIENVERSGLILLHRIRFHFKY